MGHNWRFVSVAAAGAAGALCLSAATAGSAAVPGAVTVRVSVSSAGAQGNDLSEFAIIAAGGRYVVFSSYSSNLVPGDTNHREDVFV